MKYEVRIASPCHADWNAMSGDARVRHCAECNLDVYNFSEMSEREIDRLVEERQGRLCARFYQRPDGTMLTKNCPTAFRAGLLRATKLTSAALATIIGFIPGLACASVAPAYPTRTSRGAGLALLQIQAAPKGVTVQVVDPSGAGIPHARVRVVSESTNAEERGLTDADGVYRFDGVATGKYRLEIQATGFFTKTLEHVSLPASVEMQVRPDVVVMGGAVATKIETVDSPIATQLDPPKPPASQKRAKKPRPAEHLPSTPSSQATSQNTPAPTKDSATH